MSRLLLLLILVGLYGLSGCSASAAQVATVTPEPTAILPTNAPSATSAPIPTLPVPLPTSAPIPTVAAALSPTSAPATSIPGPTLNPPSATEGMPPAYMDDRSSGETLMRSYVNAINRKEYVRAYSYWEPQAQQRPPFDRFEQGFANTASVELTIGTVTGDAGAGQFYNSVPVVLVSHLTNGQTQTFAGCYVTHLGSPSAQGAPPFQPLGFRSADVRQVPDNSAPAPLLANACQGPNLGGPLPPQPTYQPNDITAGRYLDDRSDPVPSPDVPRINAEPIHSLFKSH